MAAGLRASTRTQVYRLAATATVLGFPLMLVEAVRRSHPLQPNQFLELPRGAATLAPGLRDVELRTARYSAWIDVSEAPIVITLRNLAGRHFCLMALDPWGDCVASVSSRWQPSGRQSLAIVGSDWKGRLVTRGVAVRARSNRIWVVSRISDRVRTGSDEAAPLLTAPSLSRVTPAGLEPITPAEWSLAPDFAPAPHLVAQLSPGEFFHRLAVLAARYPLPAANRRLLDYLQRLERIRSAEGGAVDAALEGGRTAGLDMIRRAAEREQARQVNNWTRAGVSYDLSHARGLQRASCAWTSLGAPRAVDLLQYFCSIDAGGAALRGAERYELHLKGSELPPVNAFWELSCCPPAAIHRGAPGATVSSDGEPVLDAGGGVRILIQQDAPPPAYRRNWLRPPEGPFSLAMRLHWPTREAMSGSWGLPPVTRVASLLPRLPQPFDEPAQRAAGRGRPRGSRHENSTTTPRSTVQ